MKFKIIENYGDNVYPIKKILLATAAYSAALSFNVTATAPTPDQYESNSIPSVDLEKQLERVYGRIEFDLQSFRSTTRCDNINLKTQDLSPQELRKSCNHMEKIADRFHKLVGSNQQPVRNDFNTRLDVFVYRSPEDYKNTANSDFGINTNNGGMYLEGNPERRGNVPKFIAHRARPSWNSETEVWNLGHEFVHYLDGRYNKAGDFGQSQRHKMVWWSEGLAEYVSKGESNTRALSEGNRMTLNGVLDATYSSSNNTVYSGGYWVVRFLAEEHPDLFKELINLFRSGNYRQSDEVINSRIRALEGEFSQWLNRAVSQRGKTQNMLGMDGNNPKEPASNTTNTNTASNTNTRNNTPPRDNRRVNDQTRRNSGGGSDNREERRTNNRRRVETNTNTDSTNVDTSTDAVTESSSSPTNLENNQTYEISSMDTGDLQVFSFNVDSSADMLSFKAESESGDVDFLGRFNQQPTKTEFDCSAESGEKIDSCEIQNPSQGLYYFSVRAFETARNVKVVATIDGDDTRDSTSTEANTSTTDRNNRTNTTDSNTNNTSSTNSNTNNTNSTNTNSTDSNTNNTDSTDSNTNNTDSTNSNSNNTNSTDSNTNNTDSTDSSTNNTNTSDSNTNTTDTRTNTNSGNADHTFPDGMSSYQAGTTVLQPKDGKVYRCKPFPYSGFCKQWSQGSNQYEPGVGSAWNQAWELVGGSGSTTNSSDNSTTNQDTNQQNNADNNNDQRSNDQNTNDQNSYDDQTQSSNSSGTSNQDQNGNNQQDWNRTQDYSDESESDNRGGDNESSYNNDSSGYDNSSTGGGDNRGSGSGY